MRILWSIFLILGLALIWNSSSEAACTGSSPTWTSTVDQASVNSCINSAANGDKINVAAGTASWSSPITLPNKDLEIIGATVVNCTGGSSSSNPVTCTSVNNTTINCNDCFVLNLGASQRISGFNMPTANTGGFHTTGNMNASKHFRVDHNRIISSGWEQMIFTGDTNCIHPQGIIDHNIIQNITIHAYMTDFNDLDDQFGFCQHVSWAQPTVLGDSTGVVYTEANHFQHTTNNINSADASYGGRQVFRFNNITSGRHTVEVHGVQGPNRGPQRFEIYHNNAQNLTGFSGTAFFRGGTGVIFGNRQAAAYSFGILFTNDRSELDDSISMFGFCDGTHPGVDQNLSGQQGGRCRDQPGVGGDTVQWDHSPVGAWNQIVKPLYLWDNLTAGSQMSVAVDSGGNVRSHILANRDFYNFTASFNGTSGMGEGPIASRPASCTAGVAYWATDDGEWNSLDNGPDGRLYKCTATNTWTLYFTPHPYPHPWTIGGGSGGGGDTTPPNPPTNLRVL